VVCVRPDFPNRCCGACRFGTGSVAWPAVQHRPKALLCDNLTSWDYSGEGSNSAAFYFISSLTLQLSFVEVLIRLWIRSRCADGALGLGRDSEIVCVLLLLPEELGLILRVTVERLCCLAEPWLQSPWFLLCVSITCLSCQVPCATTGDEDNPQLFASVLCQGNSGLLGSRLF